MSLLAADPQPVIDALEQDGTLESLGIKPDGAEAPSVRPQAAEEPASYVVDSARFPRGKKPDDIYQYASLRECTQEHARESGRLQGWIKNRYSYCQRSIKADTKISCTNRGCTTSYLLFRHSLFGYGKLGGHRQNANNRWAAFKMRIEPLRYTGIFRSPAARLTARLECSGTYRNQVPLPRGKACYAGDRNGRTDSILGWRANKETSMELISDALTPGAQNTPQVAVGVFNPTFQLKVPGFSRNSWDGVQGGMRFDSAWYLTTNRAERLGSVFDRARPGPTFRLDDPAVKGAAKHIYEARRNPAATIPTAAGKHLPGATPDDPLRRLARRAGQWQADRFAATERLTRNGYCRTSMPAQPPTGGPFDCDEYPFASTYEGASRAQYEGARYTNHWSVRWINRDQNQEAGRRLGRWYVNDRILDHNYFFIPISG
jgi:hypothetical protein